MKTRTPARVVATPAELSAALRLLGYKAGYPARLTAESRAADEELARSGSCPGCGSPELDAWPWNRPGTASYRLYALCANCGHVDEV
jgi:hypothetical protein